METIKVDKSFHNGYFFPMTTTLKNYIEENGRSVKQIANEVGVTPVAFYRYMAGTRNPKPAIATKIVIACNHEVPFESLFYSDARLGTDK